MSVWLYSHSIYIYEECAVVWLLTMFIVCVLYNVFSVSATIELLLCVNS